MINTDRLYKIFSDLVSIDSPSFRERGVADYIIQLGKDRGINFIEDKSGEAFGGNAGNLYAYIEGDRSLEPVLLSAHMDTVEPALGKKAVLHEDGKITSAKDTVLGADDLAGISSILEAVQSAKEAGLRTRPTELLFTIAEEPYCKGITGFDVSKLKSKEAYIFDLSGKVGTAAYKAPIILSFNTVIHGRPSHAGFEPEKGIHSVKIAAAAINKIPCGRLDGLTVNIGTIQGGNLNNIVPEYCRVGGEIRSFNNESAHKMCMKIKNIFEESCCGTGAKLSFEFTEHFRAYETDLNSSTVKRFKEACKALELETKLVGTFGGSDNNFLSANGLSGLVVATAMNDCHSTDEWSSLDELSKASKLALKLISPEE